MVVVVFLPTRVLLSKLFHHGGVVYSSSSSFTSCSPLRITINLLLVKALNMNIIPYQIDIGHAFLDGKIMKLWAHASLFRSPPPLFSSLLPDYLH